MGVDLDKCNPVSSTAVLSVKDIALYFHLGLTTVIFASNHLSLGMIRVTDRADRTAYRRHSRKPRGT